MVDDYNMIARRTVTNVMAGTLWVLNDVFGFGKQRLHKFRENFDELMRVLADIDYLGERYVRLEDFAIELNEKYDLGIDVNCVAACQEVYDKGDKSYRLCRIDKVLEELRENGFEDAVKFIENKKQPQARMVFIFETSCFCGDICKQTKMRATESNP